MPPRPTPRHLYFLRFAPEGIDFRWAEVESRLGWELYQGLESDEHNHLLLYGGDGFTAIPRRAFSGPEQEAAFLALARSAIKAA